MTQGVVGAGRRGGSRPPTICILAGGLGTRLGVHARGQPKALVEVAGEPFLLHQLGFLARTGVQSIVLCVGYKGELIEERIGARRFGMSIEYSYDGHEPRGTLGALRRALTRIPEDKFLFMYGDTYVELDLGRVMGEWEGSHLPAMMTVFNNNGRWCPSNVLYEGGVVRRYSKTNPTGDMRWIDYGVGGLTRAVVERSGLEMRDLSALQGVLAEQGLLCGIEADRRFYEIGSPMALAKTRAVFEEWRAAGRGAGAVPAPEAGDGAE